MVHLEGDETPEEARVRTARAIRAMREDIEEAILAGEFDSATAARCNARDHAERDAYYTRTGATA